VVTFGFGLPALKEISANRHIISVKSRVLSEMFTVRCYLFFLSGILLLFLTIIVPFVRENLSLYIIVFSSTLITIFAPNSYFQGMQKMKILTNINLVSRLLSIFLIFIFVKSPTDLIVYSLIVSLLPVFGSIVAFFYILFVDKTPVKFISLKKTGKAFREALPFFGTSILGKIKQESIPLILGATFDMGSVALWDLTNKIVSIPRLITASINDAIFPSVMNNLFPDRIKRIIRNEKIIGLTIVFAIVALGYWAVLWLGGESMLAAYPLACILSTTVYANLIVSCYFYFVFVPQNRYAFVPKNQLASLLSFMVMTAVGLVIYKSITILVLAFTLSVFVEIFYCKYTIKKHQLL
jgi:PST family polysaccharide transporter